MGAQEAIFKELTQTTCLVCDFVMKMTKSKHTPFVPRLHVESWKGTEAEFEQISTVKFDALVVIQCHVSTIWNHTFADLKPELVGIFKIAKQIRKNNQDDFCAGYYSLFTTLTTCVYITLP